MRLIGPDDAFSRLGGDEFLLARPRARGATLDATLSRLLAAIPPLTVETGAEPLRLSLSAGVAEARPDDTWAGPMQRAIWRSKRPRRAAGTGSPSPGEIYARAGASMARATRSTRLAASPSAVATDSARAAVRAS